MAFDIGLYTSPTGTRLDIPTHQATGVSWSTNEHGYERMTATIPLNLADTLYAYSQIAVPWVTVSEGGRTVWAGRCEDPTLFARDVSGLKIAALGPSRALDDGVYTAAWSSSGCAAWRAATKSEIPTEMHERFAITIKDTIRISPKRDELHGNAINAAVVCSVPSLSQRAWSVCQFAYTHYLPTGWEWFLQGYNEDWSYIGTIGGTVAGTGALATGAVYGAFTARARFVLILHYGVAGTTRFGGETGDAYVELSGVRLATSSANAISTTLSAAAVNGSSVTLTVASTARMAPGQQVVLNGGGRTEQATITSVPSAASVTVASLSNAPSGGYPIGTQVLGIVIYADEIARDLVATTNTRNPAQLSSATALIQSPGLDLRNEVYEDESPAAILGRLIPLGDNTIPPRRWEWLVNADRQLITRPISTANKTWYVDVTSLEVQRSLEQLVNSSYGVYQNASGETVRGATSTAGASVARYGLTRLRPTQAKTTSITQANVQRDTLLGDRDDPTPHAKITFDAVYDSSGERGRLWDVAAGDTFVLRNLPITGGAAIDRIRSFRLSHTDYDADTNRLNVEPEAPIATLETMLARQVKGL